MPLLSQQNEADMSPKTQTSIELKGIAAVLKEQRLAVPVHNRSFEWGATEVRELLDDVAGAFDRAEEYFLGTIVIISPTDHEPPKVIDGQQRLATVALLLAGIADCFANAKDDDRSREMRTQYLMPFDIESGEKHPQLKLNQIDEPYFRALLLEEFSPPNQAAPDSHSRLFEARNIVSDWLLTQTGDRPDPISWLVNFTTFLTQSANVILVKVPDDANAFLIFETLNDRGLDLSIADLLKNYLLGRAQDDLPVVLSHWTTAIGSLGAYGGENLFSVFLRHHWSSKYAVVREKDLYRDIKARIVSRPHALEFSEDLAQNSYLYAAILSPEHEFWGDSSLETREGVRTLHLLGLEQYRPTLLAAMAHFPVAELDKLVRLLINWNVRLLIVGGLGGGVMERHYSELGRGIRQGAHKNATQLAERAATFVPTDLAFRDAFAGARVSKTTLAKYYLRELEGAASGDAASEHIPSSTLTLEHVLPERPLDNWPQFSEEELTAYVKRLGNLALLTQRLNTKLRSAPFSEKRQTYAASNLVLTAELAQFDEWMVSSIEERQQRLADLAVPVWSLA